MADGKLQFSKPKISMKLQSPVSYSVTKKFRKKKCEISPEWHFKIKINSFIFFHVSHIFLVGILCQQGKLVLVEYLQNMVKGY